VLKVAPDEFGWLAYVNGASAVQGKDGVLLCFRHMEDVWIDDKGNIIKLHSFSDINYTDVKKGDIGKRYLEYNIQTGKMRLVDNISEAVHERDQCCYIFIVWTDSHNGNIAYDAIMKERKKMIIRKGIEADLELYFQLWWLNSMEHVKYNQLDRLVEKERVKLDVVSIQRECLRCSDYIFLVAEERRALGLIQIAGMACGHVGDRDEPGYEVDKEGYVDEMFVLPGYRRKRIGKMLLDELIKRLYEKGAMFIGLGVAAQNPAVEFYKSQGFQIKSYWMTRMDKKKECEGVYPTKRSGTATSANRKPLPRTQEGVVHLTKKK